MALQIHQLQAQKPRSVENDFTEVVDTHEGLVIHNSRYKTKVRPGSEVCNDPYPSSFLLRLCS
jgi:hypothetical protein